MHQPTLLIVHTFLSENDMGIELVVFPNPTSDFLTLQVNNPKGLFYILYSPEGKILESKSLVSDITNISLGKFPPSTYILNVVDKKNSQIQSYIIIKK